MGRPRQHHVVVCVHGLTRNGRDFDILATHLAQHCRVVSMDVVGRGGANLGRHDRIGPYLRSQCTAHDLHTLPHPALMHLTKKFRVT
jgi:pimeloyl-ACP methyl ester carboxylesterase